MELNNAYIEKWITDRMSKIEFNNLNVLPGFAFDIPSVAFSRGDDPLYAFYKNHIDPNFYRLPSEWLKAVYGHDFDPAKVSVISWFLPQTDDTKEKSRKTTDCPPMEWTMNRVHGEECNRQLAKALEQHWWNWATKLWRPWYPISSVGVIARSLSRCPTGLSGILPTSPASAPSAYATV